MHEFAYVILKHEMIKYDTKTGLPLRKKQYEDEAVYLGGCLQIPRRGLLWAKQKQMTTLMLGVGGASFKSGSFALEGIGLSSIIGVLLNLLLPQDKKL